MADSFQLKAILSAVDKMSPVLKGIQGATKNTRKYLGDLASAAGNLAGKVGLPLAALTGALSGGLALVAKRTITDFATVGAALDDLSKRTGVSAESLQVLQYQAEMSDVSMEGLQAGVARLNKGIGEAAAGKNKDLAALFGKLNVRLRDSKGQLRDAVDLLPELSDAFARNTNEVTRARMGNALFGKGYQELLPLLVEGSQALTDLQVEYKKLGLTLTNDQVAAAAALDDSFVKLRYATGGLFAFIGAKLAPVIAPLIDRFINWAAANRDLIATRIGEFVEQLAQAVQSFDLTAFLEGLSQFLARARELLQVIGGMKTVLIALAVVMAAGPLLSILQLVGAVGRLSWFLGTSLFTALGTVIPLLQTMASVVLGTVVSAVAQLGMALGLVFKMLMANPIVLVIAGIAAAAFLIIQNWEQVKTWFAEFFDWVGEKWRALSGWVGGVASTLGGLFGGSSGGVQAPAQGASSTSLAAAGAQRVGGSIGVEFRNAPAGMRVTDTRSTPGFDLNAAVGYRGFALDSQ